MSSGTRTRRSTRQPTRWTRCLSSTTPNRDSPRAERAAERKRGVGDPGGLRPTGGMGGAPRLIGRGAEPLTELIELVLESLAGLEVRRLGSRDLDRLARFVVS